MYTPKGASVDAVQVAIYLKQHSIAVPTRKETEKLANLYNNRQIEAPAISKEAPISTGETIELGPSINLEGDMLKVYQTWSVQCLTSIRSIADATGIGRTKVNELLNQLHALGYIER